MLCLLPTVPGLVSTVLVLAATTAVGILAAPAPAGGHTRIAGTAPADGTLVEDLPDRVTITFTAKPATVEGDPLRVYDPSGRRIDDGDVRLARGGEELSVGLSAGEAAAGRYAVAYHVVSADSHLVAGRFEFTVTGQRRATRSASTPAHRPGRGPVPVPHRQPRPAGPADVRPELSIAGVAVASAAFRLRRSQGARRSGP